MMAATSIQWCDHSINPIRARSIATGAVGHYCEKIAAGCANCYASALQRRFQMPEFGSGQKRGDVELFLDASKLEEVRRRKKPTRYFWCDMTDLFGRWVKPEWLRACFETMDSTPQHTHLVLTKRPENVRRMWPLHSSNGNPIHGGNVWLGTSIATQADADCNIPALLKCRGLAAKLFVSAEPLLEAVDLSPWLSRLDWLIVGGESGPRARPCDVGWIRSLVAECRAAGVPCFVKQFGSRPAGLRDWCDRCNLGLRSGQHGLDCDKSRVLVDRKGGNPAEWPDDLRVREFPTC